MLIKIPMQELKEKTHIFNNNTELEAEYNLLKQKREKLLQEATE